MSSETRFVDRFSVNVQAINVANRRVLLDNSSAFGETHYLNPREILSKFAARFITDGSTCRGSSLRSIDMLPWQPIEGDHSNNFWIIVNIFASMFLSGFLSGTIRTGQSSVAQTVVAARHHSPEPRFWITSGSPTYAQNVLGANGTSASASVSPS